MPTIGVSIAVPDPQGRRLQDYRIGLGDDSARQIPTHITLLPPTDIAPDDLPAVVRHLEQAADGFPAFRLHLRGTGTFRPVSPVVFIGVVEGISQCEQLNARVRTGPLRTKLRFPYHPHVTIAQDLPDDVLDRAFDELSGFDCVVDVTDFHLYVHGEEAGWQPTRTFPLAPGN